MIAWHFLPDDGRLRYKPRRKVKAGQTLKFKGEPILCKQGYHASQRIIDALNYATGPIVCRVECGGIIVHGADKLVATERTVIAMDDISTLLFEFACDVASKALRDRRREGHKIDPRSYAAIRARRKWLKGEINDDELSAAWLAAKSAAKSAAEAAESAVEAAWAAFGSAGSAARSAAWSAGLVESTGPTRIAAWLAAGAAQDCLLEKRVKKLLGCK